MKRMKYLFIAVLFGIPSWIQARYCSREDLNRLDSELGCLAIHEHTKRMQIQSIETLFTDEFAKDSALFEAYKSYSYDTALIYANRQLDVASIRHDAQRIAHAQLCISFAYLSAALFKESAEMFALIDLSETDSTFMSRYYADYARLYYDMADFVEGTNRSDYIELGNQMSEQALQLLSPQDTIRYWSVSALSALKHTDYYIALDRFQRILTCSQCSLHDKAVAYSSMAYLHYTLADTTQAAHYWIQAAIADIRSSTKETTAMNMIAELCHLDGDSEHANRYIRQALDDATFYNARHRQLSVSKLLPIIEGQQMQQLQQQNHFIRLQNIALLMLALLAIVSMVVAFSRSRAVKRAQKNIEQMNTQLTEANRIKQECIGTFVATESRVYSTLEKYQRYVRRGIQEHETDKLTTIPSWADTHALRADFYQRFDTMIWQIFPHFNEDYYANTHPDDLIPIPQNGELNAELRIWALMRLGITDNRQIANILDYSINTIYTYKTRIHAQSNK